MACGGFASLAADFDQDGHDDLYLGCSNGADAVLRWKRNRLVLDVVDEERFVCKMSTKNDNDGKGEEFDLESPCENTMGMGTGDLNGDGFPDVVIGTGSPGHVDYDFAYCNAGLDPSSGVWLGFKRCLQRYSKLTERQ